MSTLPDNFRAKPTPAPDHFTRVVSSMVEDACAEDIKAMDAPPPAATGETPHEKYPNISAISNGTISGEFREWPLVKPEAIALLRELAEARAEADRWKNWHGLLKSDYAALRAELAAAKKLAEDRLLWGNEVHRQFVQETGRTSDLQRDLAAARGSLEAIRANDTAPVPESAAVLIHETREMLKGSTYPNGAPDSAVIQSLATRVIWALRALKASSKRPAK